MGGDGEEWEFYRKPDNASHWPNDFKNAQFGGAEQAEGEEASSSAVQPRAVGHVDAATMHVPTLIGLQHLKYGGEYNTQYCDTMIWRIFGHAEKLVKLGFKASELKYYFEPYANKHAEEICAARGTASANASERARGARSLVLLGSSEREVQKKARLQTLRMLYIGELVDTLWRAVYGGPGPQCRKALSEADSQVGMWHGRVVVFARDCDHLRKTSCKEFVMDAQGSSGEICELFRKERLVEVTQTSPELLEVTQYFVPNDHQQRSAIPGVGGKSVRAAAQACRREQLQLQGAAASGTGAASSSSSATAAQQAAAAAAGGDNPRELLTVDIVKALKAIPKCSAAVEAARKLLDTPTLEATLDSLGKRIYSDGFKYLVRDQTCCDEITGDVYQYQGGPLLVIGKPEMIAAQSVSIRGPLRHLCYGVKTAEALRENVLKYSKGEIVEKPRGHFEPTPNATARLVELGIRGDADIEETLDRLGIKLIVEQRISLYANGGLDGKGPGAKTDHLLVVQGDATFGTLYRLDDVRTSVASISSGGAAAVARAVHGAEVALGGGGSTALLRFFAECSDCPLDSGSEGVSRVFTRGDPPLVRITADDVTSGSFRVAHSSTCLPLRVLEPEEVVEMLSDERVSLASWAPTELLAHQPRLLEGTIFGLKLTGRWSAQIVVVGSGGTSLQLGELPLTTLAEVAPALRLAVACGQPVYVGDDNYDHPLRLGAVQAAATSRCADTALFARNKKAVEQEQHSLLTAGNEAVAAHAAAGGVTLFLKGRIVNGIAALAQRGQLGNRHGVEMFPIYVVQHAAPDADAGALVGLRLLLRGMSMSPEEQLDALRLVMPGGKPLSVFCLGSGTTGTIVDWGTATALGVEERAKRVVAAQERVATKEAVEQEQHSLLTAGNEAVAAHAAAGGVTLFLKGRPVDGVAALAQRGQLGNNAGVEMFPIRAVKHAAPWRSIACLRTACGRSFSGARRC